MHEQLTNSSQLSTEVSKLYAVIGEEETEHNWEKQEAAIRAWTGVVDVSLKQESDLGPDDWVKVLREKELSGRLISCVSSFVADRSLTELKEKSRC